MHVLLNYLCTFKQILVNCAMQPCEATWGSAICLVFINKIKSVKPRCCWNPYGCSQFYGTFKLELNNAVFRRTSFQHCQNITPIFLVLYMFPLVLGFDCWVKKPCYCQNALSVIGGSWTQVLADSMAIAGREQNHCTT